MARSRNIKPSFFQNEYLSELPPHARLLFEGLWCLADREGRLEDRPKRIKAEIFPYEDVDVDALLTMLADSREHFIVRYEIGGEQYIQVQNFLKHQTPHIKEAASTIPAPCKNGTSTGKSDASTSKESLIPDSLNLIPDSLNPPPPAGETGEPRGSKKPKEPKEPEKTAAQVLDEWDTPYADVKAALGEFLEFRKTKEPMSALAMTKAINKIMELSMGNGKMAHAIVDQSIIAKWTGLFPVKSGGVGGERATNKRPGAALPDDGNPY